MRVVCVQVDWTQTYEIPAAFTALASEVHSDQPQVLVIIMELHHHDVMYYRFVFRCHSALVGILREMA